MGVNTTERTEEDKLTQSPILVILGGKEYPIRPLVIKESREWRRKLVVIFKKLPQYLKMTTDNPEGFSEALNEMLIEMPDMVTDLFFSYAKDLDREEIESSATEEDLSKAFQEVIKYAFPLSQSLTRILENR